MSTHHTSPDFSALTTSLLADLASSGIAVVAHAPTPVMRTVSVGHDGSRESRSAMLGAAERCGLVLHPVHAHTAHTEASRVMVFTDAAHAERVAAIEAGRAARAIGAGR